MDQARNAEIILGGCERTKESLGDDGTTIEIECSCPLPSHGSGNGDKNPCCKFWVKEDGFTTVSCLADCDAEEILAHLNIEQPRREPIQPKKPIATWDFKDLKGKVRYHINKYPKGTIPPYQYWHRGKTVNGKQGDFIWGYKNKPKFFYNLCEAMFRLVDSGQEHNVLYGVEGMKDADTFRKANPDLAVISFCGGGGAKLTDSHREQLKELPFDEIRYIQDNDSTGDKAMKTWRGIAQELNVPFRGYKTPLEHKGADYTDHHEAGMGLDELVELTEVQMQPVHLPDNLGTDDEAARYLNTQLADQIRYCPGRKDPWLVFQGKVWDGGFDEAVELARGAFRSRINLAVENNEDASLIALMRKNLGKRAIENALSLNKANWKIQESELNAHEDLLPCQNGELNLRTLELHEHKPEHYFTKIAAVDYDKDAHCSIFLETLSYGIKDAQVMNFVLKSLGLAVLPDQSDWFFQWYGEGSNGKTTIATSIARVLGDGISTEGFAATTPMSCWLTDGRRKGGSAPRPDLMTTRDARFLLSSEPNANGLIDDGLLKSYTGGDPINERGLYQDHSRPFTPTGSIFLLTNHQLQINDSTHGMWRRVMFIHWDGEIPADKARTKMAEWLFKNEGPGILNLLADMAHLYLTQGKPEIPKVMTEKLEAYRLEMNKEAEFLEEMCCREDDSVCVSLQALHRRYTWFCDERGYKPKSYRGFNKQLRRAGLDSSGRAPNGDKAWKGLQLKGQGLRVVA